MDWLILFPFYPPFRLCDWYYYIVFTAISLSNLSRYWLASVRIDALPHFYLDPFQLGWKIGLRDTPRSGFFLYKPDGHNSCCPHYTIRYSKNNSVYPLMSFLLTKQPRDWTHRLFSLPKTRERLRIDGITTS